MKKKILVILFACFCGVALALPALSLTKKESVLSTVHLYVLQTGVFNKLENAIEQQKQYENAIIYPDSGQYRVLVGASTKESELKKIEKILQEQDIHYYKKEIQVIETSDLINKYNLLLENTDDEATIKLLNRKILERMIEI
mgnify:CR=1 FL=1